MKSMTIKDTYPIQATEISKDEAKFSNCDEIIEYLKEQIEKHPVAVFISVFDHYTHTKSLPEHKMDDKILDVKLIVFCFGKELPVPEMAAVRPRSIAVVEESDRFVLSFMDAPNPVAHESMTNWVKSIKK